MPELGPSGSVRGAPSNGRPYSAQIEGPDLVLIDTKAAGPPATSRETSRRHVKSADEQAMVAGECRRAQELSDAGPSIGRTLASGCETAIRYAPSANPRNTIADATPAKSHKVSATRPRGRIMLNPNASIAAAPIPLKITAHLIGTSRISYRLPTNGTAIRAR